jgi:hypothetical protein
MRASAFWWVNDRLLVRVLNRQDYIPDDDRSAVSFAAILDFSALPLDS